MQKNLLLLTNFFLHFTLMASPWGKDADLARPCPIAETCLPINNNLFVKLGESVIRFHQEVISPADGPRSHFVPSSSQYMLDAIRKYGFCTGYIMGCDRLMRENDDPWIYRTIIIGNNLQMKWDPIK